MRHLLRRRNPEPDQGYAARVAHAHALTFAASTLTKRYTSWDRDEPRREWSALQHLHRHAPDLVPEPLAADLHSVPPAVTMTIIPGQPLCGQLTPTQISGLTAAITSMWAIPLDNSTTAGPWRDDLPFARQLTDGPRPTEPTAATAYDAALAWWNGQAQRLLHLLDTERRVTG